LADAHTAFDCCEPVPYPQRYGGVLPSLHSSHTSSSRLKFLECLDCLASLGQHTENVESNSLAQGSALADSDDVTLVDTEGRGNVCGQVLVSLLVSGVLGNEVEVFSANDQGSVHLGGNDSAGEDTASDGDLAGERAFLVDV